MARSRARAAARQLLRAPLPTKKSAPSIVSSYHIIVVVIVILILVVVIIIEFGVFWGWILFFFGGGLEKSGKQASGADASFQRSLERRIRSGCVRKTQ